jgi:hypothetical protein
VVGYEVGLGLLAITVRAALAWSDEKGAGREALDVLLTSPLEASAFVTGKWWGVYRGVLWLTILPALSVVILAASAPTHAEIPPWYTPTLPVFPLRPMDRALVAATVIGHVVLYGAVFVSLGVSLATRLDRPSRAVMGAVTVFIIVAAVAPTVSEMLFLQFNRPLSNRLALISPLGGPIVTLASMFDVSYTSPGWLLPANLACLCAAGALSWGLLRWTNYRFDRWMGRMPSSTTGGLMRS